MTGSDGREPPKGAANVGPEGLELRARPQPVTRINRKVVIGGAAVLLFLISCIVLIALKPPSFRVAGPQELFNVDHKPITDALSKLPATYDGVKPDKKPDAGKQPPAGLLVPPGVPDLKVTVGDGLTDAERAEKARLARLAGQARESPVAAPMRAALARADSAASRVWPCPDRGADRQLVA